MKMRTVGGVVLVGGIAIGAMLSGLFNGFGLGTGDGDGGTGSTRDTIVGIPSSSTVAEPEDSPDADTAEDADRLPPPALTDTLSILIDGHDFLIDRPDTESRDWVKIGIDDLATRIAQTTGNAEQIRVVVFLRPTARASAEELLKQKLVELDVPATDVRWEEKPLED